MGTRRSALLFLVSAALCACGNAPGPATETETKTAWPLDGFLAYLPENVATTLRLPPAGDPGSDALLAMLGRAGQLLAAETGGLDTARGQGLVLTTDGGWAHFLPATDKAALNRALADQAARTAHREEGDWIILSHGAKPGAVTGEPLPPGSAAIRVRFHKLLDTVFAPGDACELGLALGAGGIDFSGRLRPGKESPTPARIERAHPAEGGLIDMMPASLAIRVETTLPAAPLAAMATRELGAHCGIGAGKDRVLIERFLRELLTGIDARTGFGLGIDFFEGNVSFVLFGKIADGPPSPLLASARERLRTSVGPLVLDMRREAPKGTVAHYAWIVDAKPALEDLPETAWSLIGDLSGGEQGGVTTTYAEHAGWFILGVGRRADRLVKGVHYRLRGNAKGSVAAQTLRQVRRRPGVEDDDYVLGIVCNGGGFAGLAKADAAMLAAALGATGDATAPGFVAVAGFRSPGEPGLKLEGRLLYR